MADSYSLVDYMELPAVERCIVRLVLREVTISYPRLRWMTKDMNIVPEALDNALKHLVTTHWLIRQSSSQHTSYRVNTLEKPASANQNFWDELALEEMPEPTSVDLHADPENAPLSTRSGGKRALPKAIWDCLCDPDTPETPAVKPAKRGAELFDSLITDSGDPSDNR